LRGETILSFLTEKEMERIDSMASQTILNDKHQSTIQTIVHIVFL